MANLNHGDYLEVSEWTVNN